MASTTLYSNLGISLLGTHNTPEYDVPDDTDTIWLRADKPLWVAGATTIYLEYSSDGGSTWTYGGGGSDVGGPTGNPTVTYSYWSNWPDGMKIRGHVTASGLNVILYNITMGYETA